MEIEEYLSKKEWSKVKSFAKKHETPFLIVLLDVIKHKYQELRKNIPFAEIYYAVKANPASEIISMLDELGSCFDVASVYELRKLLSLGVAPERLSCGNTIKKIKDIEEFYRSGVRLFATDSETDIRNIAKAAPGSKILVRILTSGFLTASWPLSRKFGCHSDMAFDLLVLANKLGLQPYGVSFHVGSQQNDIAAWNTAIDQVKQIFTWTKDEGINLKCINMGGGLPANYIEKCQDIELYASEITKCLKEDFNGDIPQVIIEPGRSLVAESGIIVSEIINVASKSKTSFDRWAFTDIGKFGGLMETLGEAIKYPIYTEKEGEPEKVIIAGPTCDSMDTIYEEHLYELPSDLEPGDRLYWLSTGAYTASYSAIEFNGFPPLKVFCI